MSRRPWLGSSRRGRVMQRVAGGSARLLAGLAAVTIGVTLAPPDADALRLSQAQAVVFRVVADAKRDAAKARVPAQPRELQEEQAEPLAEARLKAGTPQELVAEDVGVVADFSGYEVPSTLDLALTEAGAAAESSAASETGGEIVGSAVEIVALDGGGDEVTEFPAEVETVADKHGVESALSVTPGITLGFDVDADAVKQAGLDPASLRIYTRETEGEPWLELPSYFDAGENRVIGESDHLSQFVVIGKKFVPPPGPRVVLDPDDDYGWAETPAPASELTYNVALANSVAAKLSQACLAQVVVTRQADVRFVSGSTRAAIAASFNPVATVTIAFDAVSGSAWGTESDGGTYLYSRGGSGDALAASLVGSMPSYTGRPAGTRPANAIFPDPAFSSVPGAMAHMETLYLDHNYDRPVIDNGFDHISNGALVGIAKYLETQGFDCSDPARGGLPAPPSKADLAKWRNLGYQNYQTYGADPVSFSTGNLVEDEELFTLSGRGEQQLDFTLVYNSQDGRLSRVGAGWSFGLGGRAQRFDDGSVLVVRGDGASFVFEPDGAGGYTGEDGLGLKLREAGAGILELRSDSGERWKYDAADIEGIGELISHTDRQGNAIRLDYGAADEDAHQFVPLTAVTDEAGQKVRFESDSVGRVTALVHPDGRRWKLAYNAAGDLTRITAPDGGVRKFTYDGEHQMLTATDALGVEYLKNQYDSSGRVVKQWDSEGNLRRFSYGDGETRYTDNEGQVSVFSWDSRKRITRVQDAAGGDTRFTFDSANRVKQATEPAGGVTAYTYDARGNVASETRPDGSVWKYTWTPTGELASETDPLGRTTAHEVDDRGLTTKTVRPDGSVIEYAYTAAGDVKAVTLPSGATEKFSYDGRGNLTTRVSAAGRTTTYAYDTANRLVSETDGTGSTIRYQYDDADNLVKLIDGLGNATAYAYDRNGNLLAETAPDGGVTSYEWDTLFRVAKITDPEGGVTEYRYNREDAVIGEVDPLGSETGYDVDPLGRVTAVTDPLGGVWGATLDAAGRATAETDPLGRETRTDYDELGQITSQIDPEGGEWGYAYDVVGNLISQTDPEGGKTELVYDELDQLVELIDPDGRSTAYEYDADGGLIAVIDAAGATTGFTIDADGLVTAAANALGEVSGFEYDAAGRMTAEIDPLGARTEIEYDAAGRPVLVRDALGGETRTEYDAVGRVTATVDPAGDRSETRYDLAGRTVATVDPLGAVTEYGYDLAGRQTSFEDADGRSTVYRYDDAGQLTSVIEGYREGTEADADANVLTQYRYTAAGELATIIDPNGGKSRFEYDKAGRPVRQVDAAGAVSTVAYDRAGRVVAQANGAGQKLVTEYTAAGLVASTSSPSGETSFEYDAAGRPIAMQDAQGATAWRYDKLGRITSETSTTNKRTKLAYDETGSVASMTLPGGEQIGYAYDALGRMTAQQTPWGDLSYEWSSDSLLTAVARGDGVRTTIASDAADRPVEIVHAEPAAKAEKPKPLAEATFPAREPAQCAAGASGYLGARALQNLEGEDDVCVKTADYLGRRTLPAPEDPVGQGGALRYSYAYSQAGQVVASERRVEGPAVENAGEEPEADAVEARGVLEAVRSTYRYDGVGRLSGSTVVDVTSGVRGGGDSAAESVSAVEPVVLAESVFEYDAAGNRTLAKTTRPEGTVRVAQEFGAGNRLLERATTGGDAAGTREFGYDGAGRRVSERGAGVDASYGYGFGGQPTSVRSGDREMSYGYDGLGRIVSESVTSAYGDDAVTQSYAGGVLVERSSEQHGDTTVLWGALGEVAGIGADTSDEARWALLDRLGSVVAEATGAAGGDISQLVDYGEYGVPGFESTGYAQFHGYTGELQDGGTGTVAFGSRSYDPSGATWFAPDAWPGLLTVPQSLNRYGFVLGDPVTLVDVGGFRPEEPGYSVSKNASGWVYRKTPAPNSPWVSPHKFNPSALLNHVENRSYFAATGRLLDTPENRSAVFLQQRHENAVRAVVSFATCVRFVLGGKCVPGVQNAALKLTNKILAARRTQLRVYKLLTDYMARNPKERREANKDATKLALLLAKAADAKCYIAKNTMIVCTEAKWGYGGGGTAYGEVFITGMQESEVKSRPGLLTHEQRHSAQWAGLGPMLFAPAYFNETMISVVVTGSPACNNWFEVNANLKKGGYSC